MNTKIPMLAGSLYNQDCVEVLRQLPSESIDFVFTDPPYLTNYRSRDGQSVKNDSARSAWWVRPAFAEVARVLKPDRFCVSFYGWNQVDRFMAAWREAGLTPVGHIVWVKSYASSVRFLRYKHEAAYLLAKGRPELPEHPLSDVLHWGRPSGNELHPTQKPVSALKPVILTFTKPGDLVLDPFMGSGSLLVAAKKLGREVIGMELDPKSFQIAAKRLEIPLREPQPGVTAETVAA